MRGPELGEILTAIREVEESLERREHRVGGALMVMWGVLVALIAAFYQLVSWNPAPYVRALGPLLPWVWVGPVGIGYAAGVVVGARYLAGSKDRERRRRSVLDLIPAFTSTAIATALVLADRSRFIAGALLVGLGASLALRCNAAGASRRFMTMGWIASALCAAVGIALLAFPVHWKWLLTGVVFGGSLILLGRLRMAEA